MGHKIANRISYDRRIGYCQNKNHKGFITKETLCEHKCLKKKCPYLQKFEQTSFWKNYYSELNKKQLRRYYARHKKYFLNMDMEYFICYAYRFYGSFLKVPTKDEKIQIDNLIEALQNEGYYLALQEA